MIKHAVRMLRGIARNLCAVSCIEGRPLCKNLLPAAEFLWAKLLTLEAGNIHARLCRPRPCHVASESCNQYTAEIKQTATSASGGRVESVKQPDKHSFPRTTAATTRGHRRFQLGALTLRICGSKPISSILSACMPVRNQSACLQ